MYFAKHFHKDRHRSRRDTSPGGIHVHWYLHTCIQRYMYCYIHRCVHTRTQLMTQATAVAASLTWFKLFDMSINTDTGSDTTHRENSSAYIHMSRHLRLYICIYAFECFWIETPASISSYIIYHDTYLHIWYIYVLILTFIRNRPHLREEHQR